MAPRCTFHPHAPHCAIRLPHERAHLLSMIELAHMASGAVAGRRCSGPFEAFLCGVALHAAGDVIPHGEVGDLEYETGSALAGIAALTARYGLRSPIVWGAVGSVIPDTEHILPRRIRPRRELFPTHRYAWLHRSGGPLAIPAWLQVLVGGAIVGAIVMRGVTAPPPRRRWLRLD